MLEGVIMEINNGMHDIQVRAVRLERQNRWLSHLIVSGSLPANLKRVSYIEKCVSLEEI